MSEDDRELDNRFGPGVRSVTAAEVVEEVAECMARRMRKGQIKDHIRTMLNATISSSTFEELFRRARQLLADRAAISKTDQIALSIMFWEQQIADPDISDALRQRAQRELQDLIGIGGQFDIGNRSAENAARAIREAVSAMNEVHVDAGQD